MEVSTLIGAEIFSPAGEKLGYVKSVYLSKDRKKITCLLCVDEGESGGEEDDEFVMPFRAVLSVKDVVIAKKARISKTIGSPAPVGINAYSDTGEALGSLCEILVGDGGPVYIVTKNGVRTSYADGSVVIGEALMVSSENGDRKKSGEKAKAQQEKAYEEKTQDESAPQQEHEHTQGEFVPMMSAPQSSLDRLNLLGRQVKITVYDKEGEIIAKSGERITPEILSLARKNNLLLRLTVNTLTNIV